MSKLSRFLKGNGLPALANAVAGNPIGAVTSLFGVTGGNTEKNIIKALQKNSEALSELKEKESEADNPVRLEISVTKNYFGVDENNLDKFGLIDPSLASKIVSFYTSLNSILEDLSDLKDGYFYKQLKELYEKLYEVMIIALKIAEELKEDIPNKYRRWYYF